jgi:hypothetical protein
MDTTINVVLVVLAVAFLALYLMRRRSRMRQDDD